MLLPPRRPGARSDAFPRGYGCYRPATQARKETFPARGTSAQSFTPPSKLPTFPTRRSPSGAPGSVATGDLSYTREASSLHGMRKRPHQPFPRARGIRHTIRRTTAQEPFPMRETPAEAVLVTRPPFPTRAWAYTATPSGAFRSSPFLRAWGDILRPFRIKRQCAHFPTRTGHQGKAEGVRFFADLSHARGYCHLFPPRLSLHEGRARNREARQHRAGPFRAGPFRLRGKVRVPLPFGSGLPVCRVLTPPRSGTDGFCPPPGGSSASARFPHSRSFHRYSAAFTRRHTVPDRPHSGRGAGSDRH